MTGPEADEPERDWRRPDGNPREPDPPDPMLTDYSAMVDQIAATNADLHRKEWARDAPREEGDPHQ